MKFNFRKHFITQLLLVVAVIGLVAAPAIPARSQVSPRIVNAFSNAPAFITASSVSNATVTQYSYLSNMVPIRPGKDLTIGMKWQQASNGQSAAITTYFGLVYNRTNASSVTNFTWAFTAPQSTAEQRVATNLPAAIIGNADGLIWFSTQNAITNTITGFQLLGQNAN